MLSQWKVRNIANYNAKLEREMEDWTPGQGSQVRASRLAGE